MDDKIAIIFQFFAFSPKHLSIYQIIPRFFSVTLSWIFHLLAKMWLKKKSRSRVYRYQTDNRLRVVRTSEWKSVTSFVRSAEVRNNSCGYHLSNLSTVFTELLWIWICCHLLLATAKILADFLALLLLRAILNRWCGSPVKAIENQRIGKRQGPLFCRKSSKVWD